MGLIIEELRKEVGFNGYEYNETIAELLVSVWKLEGYSVEEVRETFKEFGMWLNYRTTIWSGLLTSVFEVVPQEVDSTTYVAK